ncbi:hypothetical protein MHY30_05140 [Microbacterium sp. ACRRU]|jgi:hypothetical protein|uniref:hypothetical protein n=1 Tax=Microbacterium sp. ACRRU TaxID=2918204 RepID=UPI001EF66C83|nr:hypothetical protein [Microbacterium sp. ACRRU]MCG7416889.1 hypothetical protein [Microbacterium sp. ACRRU]
MGQRPSIRVYVVFALSVLLIGAALWMAWRSASSWASCVGASWIDMNPACAEAMSTYEYTPLINLWVVLAVVVSAAVVGGIVPRIPIGAVAVVAVVIACPLFDDGFFWVDWGSADGIPGHGLWTACWLAVAALTMLFPSPRRSPSARGDLHEHSTTPAPRPENRGV